MAKLNTTREKSEWMISRMEEIVRHLEIPTSLKMYGIDRQDLNDLVAAGMDVQRLLINNVREVTPEDAKNIYLSIM